MAQETDAFFEVDSRLLLQLGEKLVKDRAVALAELVKNSYDADATKVKICMYNIKEPGGTIVVEDNGAGMSLSNFQKTWMRIATIDKENNPVSNIYKRDRAGEKGIGRFACRSLSKILILKSIAKAESGNKEELNATFNWESFKSGFDINKIPVAISTRILNSDVQTGTTLTLKNTNGSWSSKDIKHLRNELRELINPTTFESKEVNIEYDPGIKMEFDIPEFPTQEEDLDAAFFKHSWARLIGSVDQDGVAEYSLELRDGGFRTFKREEQFNYIKDVNFETRIFSYDSEYFKSSDWSLSRAAKIGRERGGIRVYADRFRIFGYGTRGDDWLRLNYDRARSVAQLDKEVDGFKERKEDRPGLRIFRNEHLFGHVTFRRESNNLLEITINRERLIENEAFNELMHFVRLGIDFSTVIYSNYVYKKQKEKNEKIKLEKEALTRAEEDVIRKAKEERENAEEAIRLAEEEKRKAEEASKRIEEERRRAEEDRRKAEEDRRKAEKIRRDLEERKLENQHKKDSKLIDELNRAKKTEQDSVKAELEAKRVEEEKIKGEEKAKKTLHEKREETEQIFRVMQGKREKIENEISSLHEEKKKKSDELFEQELSQLRVLASTGTLILVFQHELNAVITNMDDISGDLLEFINKSNSAEKDMYKEDLEAINERVVLVKEFSSLLDLTSSHESRSEKRPWALRPIIEDITKYLRWYAKKHDITCNYDAVEEDLHVPSMYKSELSSILHNLMTNAFKAVRQQPVRLIDVRGFEDEAANKIRIQFLDTGKGLEKEKWEEVFEPFVSYSEPDMEFGSGTGLGLKIVRDLVRTYDGDVSFITPPENWKTCIEIVFPRGEP
ncbi:MAG: ATP-binding protein [Methanotrichaceae archaeon]